MLRGLAVVRSDDDGGGERCAGNKGRSEVKNSLLLLLPCCKLPFWVGVRERETRRETKVENRLPL